MCSCSCEWKSNIRECEAPRGTGVDEIGLRTRDLSSRVTEEHLRVRVRDRHQLVDYHRLLGASRSAGSPRDWNKSSAYWRPASKLESVKNVENKNVATFFSWVETGVRSAVFFAAIGGVQFCLFLRGLFLHKKNLTRSSFSCFDRGMRRRR